MTIKTMRDAINEALRQEMQRDPCVIILGEDVAGGMGGTSDADEAGGGVAAWAERRGGTLADWGCSTGFQRPNQSPGLPNPLLVSPVRRPLSVCVVACAFSRIRYCSVLRTNIIS